MSVAHLYQDFGSSLPGFDTKSFIEDVDLEEQKLEAFENGYQAGWDDSVNAQIASNKRISSDLERNLQEASFSYHEARTTLTKSLEPLFSDILNTLLPEIARQSLGPQIITQLTEMVRIQLDQVIEVTVAPTHVETISALIEGQINEPFVMVPDPTLSEGQVYIRIGAEERELDLDHVLETVSSAFSSFFTTHEQDA